MNRIVLALVALLLPLAVRAAEEPVFADLAGRHVKVSQHRGEVVVLNFWATWCGPCRTEMPAFAQLHRDLGPKGLRVLAVAADGLSDAEKVKSYRTANGMTFDTWLWATAGDMRHWGVGPGLPATLVLDRDGSTAATFRGVVTADQLRPVVEKLLAKEPPVTPAAPGSSGSARP